MFEIWSDWLGVQVIGVALIGLARVTGKGRFYSPLTQCVSTIVGQYALYSRRRHVFFFACLPLALRGTIVSRTKYFW